MGLSGPQQETDCTLTLGDLSRIYLQVWLQSLKSSARYHAVALENYYSWVWNEQGKGTGLGILREYIYGEGHPTGAVTLVKGRSQSPATCLGSTWGNQYPTLRSYCLVSPCASQWLDELESGAWGGMKSPFYFFSMNVTTLPTSSLCKWNHTVFFFLWLVPFT